MDNLYYPVGLSESILCMSEALTCKPLSSISEKRIADLSIRSLVLLRCLKFTHRVALGIKYHQVHKESNMPSFFVGCKARREGKFKTGSDVAKCFAVAILSYNISHDYPRI